MSVVNCAVTQPTKRKTPPAVSCMSPLSEQKTPVSGTNCTAVKEVWVRARPAPTLDDDTTLTSSMFGVAGLMNVTTRPCLIDYRRRDCAWVFMMSRQQIKSR